MTWQGGSVSVSGNLYNVTTGSDIGPAVTNGNPRISLTVGGDLGSLVTGLSPVPGGARPNEGDVNFLDLNVGGRIGMMDIRGGVGMDQDEADPRAQVGENSLNITTGRSGGNGDIGMIRVGFHVAGDSFNITTSPNSVIGALLVSQDVYDDGNPRSGIYEGTRGIRINSGAGSDVRFADTPSIGLTGGVDITYQLIGGEILDLIDDGGTRVQISVANAPPGQQVGLVRAMPVDGSQGVVISQILANLTGGRTLQINGVDRPGARAASIGHILALGDGASSIQINGNVEIDVWRIEERDTRAQIAGFPGGGGTGGGAGGFAFIENNTPGGDMVSIDVTAAGRISTRGDLGITQAPSFGPDKFGPFLGLSVGLVGDVGGALGIPGGALLDNDLTATKIFRAVADDNYNSGQASLDDIGAPFDEALPQRGRRLHRQRDEGDGARRT